MRPGKGSPRGICLKCLLIHRPQHEALLAQLISDGSGPDLHHQEGLLLGVKRTFRSVAEESVVSQKRTFRDFLRG